MTDQDTQKDKYKNDGFGHTSWTIPKRDFNFQEHNWMQEGALIVCTGAGHPYHASPIAMDKMLVKEEGEYKIVPIRVLS